MLQNWVYLLLAVSAVCCLPNLFDTKKFRIGIEYDHSRPMRGGSDRFRHRNNYDPFFVTITATAKSGFVITFLEVTATVDGGGDLDFKVIRGETGSSTIVFQLVSNHSDFLSYSYLTYGLKVDEYRKLANIITLPDPIPVAKNNGLSLQNKGFTIITFLFLIYLNIYNI